MYILASNDDGVYAPGLEVLHKVLSEIADVTVIAPDRDRSAASKSLTLNSPIYPRTLDNGFISVDGTPTDCVHFGLTALLENNPDMVVSGINAGANLGDDVLYSGTVAAATEGRFLGYPSVATSLVGEGKHYDSAGKVVRIIIEQLITHPLPAETILNVNIPDIPFDSIKGFKVARLGQRHQAENMIKMQDPRGKTVYWIGPSGKEQDAGPGTDFHAVSEGYVSLTPLDLDLTKHDAMDSLKSWSQGLPIK